MAPYLVVLAAFAFRIYAFDTTWIDKDRANPHGIGLIIADAIAAGRLSGLPLFADPSTIQLPNPPFISYFWSLVAIFDRSLNTATALGLMLNAAGVAITYRLARALINWEAGIVAATLMAASNWSVYFARGAWHPAHYEIGVILSVWLLVAGLGRTKVRDVIPGYLAVVLTAGTYLQAFALFPQTVLATIVAGSAGKGRRRAWVTGLAVFASGVLLYGLALAGSGLLDRVAGNSLVAAQAPLTAEEMAARDITPFNREALPHFLRLASGADYAVTWTNPAIAWHGVRVPLSQAQAALVSIAVLAGLYALARRWREPAPCFLLIWAAIPVVVLVIVAALRAEFRIPPYYLLSASPVMYLAGGIGVALALRRVRASAAATLIACGALMVIPAWNLYAAAQTVYTQAWVGLPDFMPLRWAERLGAAMRAECRTLNGSGNFYQWWAISLSERPDIRRDEGARFNEISSVWSIAPGGGACALKQSGPPMPNAEFLWVPLDDGSRVRVDHARPYSGGNDGRLTVNLGWTLMDFDAPIQATAGTTLTVRHAWRVDSLPSEPFTEWYFAPFIKLAASDGRVVASIDRSASLLGWGWRVGELILSDTQVSLPKDLPPGQYTIDSSLYDPNQKKNAVYFDPSAPGFPFLNLKRSINIVAP